VDVEELIERFSIFDDQEERYAYLIELGRKLPPFDDAARTELNKVRGCVSQVWLTHTVQAGADGVRIAFQADSDAFIVKGLVAVLLALYSDRTPAEILAIPIEDIFEQIGLSGHLTPSRRNGFFSMVGRIRGIAEAAMRDVGPAAGEVAS
jgi:cysteine desulfuration protein SufE